MIRQRIMKNLYSAKMLVGESVIDFADHQRNFLAGAVKDEESDGFATIFFCVCLSMYKNSSTWPVSTEKYLPLPNCPRWQFKSHLTPI